jgi:hypothetical protein
MCLLIIVLLVFPGTKLDSLWNLNPDAHVAFQSARGLVDLAYVRGRDWMRFDSNRSVASNAVGNSAGSSDSLGQHRWRSSECSHAPRLSVTSRPADRRSNDLLFGLVYERPQN